MSDVPPAPAGWYPDPAGTAGRRYWDGAAWGESAPPLRPPVLPRQAYTRWITRVGAFLIDILPVAIILAAAGVIGDLATDCSLVRPGVTDPGHCGWAIDKDVLLGLSFVLALLLYPLALAFGVWNWGYRQGRTGSSLGKSVLKFKVVNNRTWQPIGFGQSIARQLIHFFVDTVFYVGFLWPLWDPQRQTFADKIVSTVCLPSAHPAGEQQLTPEAAQPSSG